MIVIGLGSPFEEAAGDANSNMPLGQYQHLLPGDYENSVGYQSNGNVYQNSKPAEFISIKKYSQQGDCAGICWVFEEESSDSKNSKTGQQKILFYNNGNFCKDVEVEGKKWENNIFVLVGSSGPCELELNIGGNGFRNTFAEFQHGILPG